MSMRIECMSDYLDLILEQFSKEFNLEKAVELYYECPLPLSKLNSGHNFERYYKWFHDASPDVIRIVSPNSFCNISSPDSLTPIYFPELIVLCWIIEIFLPCK